MDDAWKKSVGIPGEIAGGHRNSSWGALERGRLREARGFADAAVTGGEQNSISKSRSIAFCAFAAHALGDIPAARADFTRATELDGRPASNWGFLYARHHLDLAAFASARTLCKVGFQLAFDNGHNHVFPWFHALLARIDLAEGNDPTPHLDEIRAWTSRTGDMHLIIEAHLLAALYLLTSGDPQAALGEAKTGLLHAVACGYGLLRIELLVAMARIRLAWPDPPKAIQVAREALDLAADPECRYAWGEADAAQVWGEAFFANHEPTLAKRAFTRALEVRQRIEHPGVGKTERWLGLVG